MEFVKCDLCGADNTTLLFVAHDTNYFREGAFNVVKCNACGLVYLHPRPTAQELKHFYPQEEYFPYRRAAGVEQGNQEQFTRPYREKVDRLTKCIGSGRVLDLGCGEGYFLKAMQNSGWETFGAEISEFASRFAQENLGLNVSTGDIFSAGFPGGFFDVVTLWDTLEHLPNPTAVLSEVHRILKSDGLIAISIPNFASPDRRLFGSEWIDIDAPRHLYHYSPKTLRQMLAKTGFDCLSLRCQAPPISLASNGLRVGRNLIYGRVAGSGGSPD